MCFSYPPSLPFFYSCAVFFFFGLALSPFLCLLSGSAAAFSLGWVGLLASIVCSFFGNRLMSSCYKPRLAQISATRSTFSGRCSSSEHGFPLEATLLHLPAHLDWHLSSHFAVERMVLVSFFGKTRLSLESFRERKQCNVTRLPVNEPMSTSFNSRLSGTQLLDECRSKRSGTF
jgi:hypothetical protein